MLTYVAAALSLVVHILCIYYAHACCTMLVCHCRCLGVHVLEYICWQLCQHSKCIYISYCHLTLLDVIRKLNQFEVDIKLIAEPTNRGSIHIA